MFMYGIYYSLFSVASAKESLMRESEEGVKLETEKNELEFRLTQIQETHKYRIIIIISISSFLFLYFLHGG